MLDDLCISLSTEYRWLTSTLLIKYFFKVLKEDVSTNLKRGIGGILTVYRSALWATDPIVRAVAQASRHYIYTEQKYEHNMQQCQRFY
jgi:hypothetical protein